MKKTIRAALLLIAAGLCVVLIALCLSGFDAAGLFTQAYETETVTVEAPFDRVRVESDCFDVWIVPAADGLCRVTYPVGEYIDYTADVIEGELRVASKEDMPWFAHLRIRIPANDSIRVELPQKEYAALETAACAGNVSVESGLNFAMLEIVTASGAIDCRADAETMLLTSASGSVSVAGSTLGSASLETSSGRISADDLHAGDFAASTSSGNARLSEIRCDDLRVQTVSGTAALSDVLAENALHAETSSGGVRLERCDAEALALSTVSGDIRGTLLSPKRFEIAELGSGRISVPAGADGGLCMLKSGSGDIRIEIAD